MFKVPFAGSRLNPRLSAAAAVSSPCAMTTPVVVSRTDKRIDVTVPTAPPVSRIDNVVRTSRSVLPAPQPPQRPPVIGLGLAVTVKARMGLGDDGEQPLRNDAAAIR